MDRHGQPERAGAVPPRGQTVVAEPARRRVLVWIGFSLLGLPAGWLLKSVAGWVASVTERTREIGLLRAVGMSRRQLRRMLRYESVMIAAFGASLGLGIGVAFGWALQRVLADEGIDVLSVPFGQLALYVVAAAILGVVAAIWPARRAARMSVLRAITTD